MRSARNFARFVALLAALAMSLAVSLMVSPLTILIGSVVFLAVCLMGMSKGDKVMTSNARDGPVSSAVDAPLDDQAMMRSQRRQWAREYPVGFRLCRSTTKHDATGPLFSVNNCIMKLSGWASLLWSAVGAMKRPFRWALSRTDQCNLYAFNANDQCLLPGAAVA